MNIEEGHVCIRGFYPSSFPRGFLGYHAEQVDNTLYVGFKFSAVFGIFETGDFDITIPTKGTVTQIVVKNGEHENTVWPTEDEFFVSETEVTENGIYVHLERLIPVMLTFSDKDGKTIAHVNMSYDLQAPVLTATLTADARIYVNGAEQDKLAVPTVYESILKEYRTALEESWTGQ